jgi:hypothetical protein
MTKKKMFLIHITSISLRILQADLLLRTTMSLQRVGDLKLAIPSVCLPASPSPHKGHHLWAHKSLGCARCDSSNRRGQGPHTPPLVSLPLSKQGKLRQRGAANIGVVTKCRGCFMSRADAQEHIWSRQRHIVLNNRPTNEAQLAARNDSWQSIFFSCSTHPKLGMPEKRNHIYT